jgi:hypothetical protein
MYIHIFIYIYIHNPSAHRDAGRLGSIMVRKLRQQESATLTDLALASVVTEVLNESEVKIHLEEQKLDLATGRPVDNDEPEDDDGSLDVAELVPRSMRCLYNTIMKDMRLWQRPPETICSRCRKHGLLLSESRLLFDAINAIPGIPGYCDHLEVLKSYDGLSKAWESYRKVGHKLIDLRRHVTWRENQRAYLKTREEDLKANEILMFLDYGGMTDSANSKVNVWSCTVLIRDRDPSHIDFFFDPEFNKHGLPGHKKNGEAGMFFMDELLNPDRGPNGDGVSLMQVLFPGKNHLLLSGDTGNGYRAYQMLHYLSMLFSLYAWRCELIPLSPGHAFNQTDARIARINAFLERVMRKGRVEGAENIAKAFAGATDPRRTTKRKFMKNTHVFFRVVVERDYVKKVKAIRLGAMMPGTVFLERVGVRSLLYFRFWMQVQ